MNLFQILSCSGDLGNCCNDQGLVLIIDDFRRIFNIIQIVVPILLILFAIFAFTKLVINPDQKDGLKRIKNLFISAIIVFFIPMFVDVVLNLTPQSFSLSSCWKQSKTVAESSRKLSFQYIAINDKEKKQTVIYDPGDYEKGKPKKSGSGVGAGISSGSAKGILEGAEKVHTMYEQNGWSYYYDLGQLTWGNVNYSTNNPSRKTCCATFVGSAFYVGGVFPESEINKYNYNSQYGISELCEAHNWIKINNYGELAPGDIVLMSSASGGSSLSHVQIYAGNGTWYNAGSTDAIQRDNPYPSDASARFLYAWRRP